MILVKNMEILEIIKNRRSIRKFKEDPIAKDIIDKLVEALIWAPSAGNLQSRKFYFVFNEQLKKELSKAALFQTFISKAPLVIIGCTNERISTRYGKRGRELYTICDVAASIQNLMLLAHSEGLGTCWVGAFSEKNVSKILELPKHLRPIVIVPVGYPAHIPNPPKRCSKEDAIKFII